MAHPDPDPSPDPDADPTMMSGCHSIELHVVLAFIMVVYSFISDYDVIVFDSVH